MHACHCIALGHIPHRVSWVLGFTSIGSANSGLALCSSSFTLQSWESRVLGASICQATSCLLPGSGSCLHLHLTSARTYPPAQAVPSSCLSDLHLARGAVLCPWSVCCHCWARFHFSSATTLGWGLDGKNSVAPGWFQETDEMQSPG